MGKYMRIERENLALSELGENKREEGFHPVAKSLLVVFLVSDQEWCVQCFPGVGGSLYYEL